MFHPINSSRKKLVVVADDFTGATDAGVQFSKAGFAVNVIIDTGRLQADFQESELLVIDLESRFDARDTAFEKCAALGRALRACGEVLVYKKMDSTFRGNVGAEIDGLMTGLNLSVTFFAPALPVYGRTTENGTVYVRGVPLEQTETALDPRTPVTLSRVADILALQTSRRTAAVPTAVFREETADIDHLLSGHIRSGAEILVFDGNDESDLQQVAQAITRMQEMPMLIAGSAGLALHLHNLPAIRLKRLAFVICGSVSTNSREQVQHCLLEGSTELMFIGGRDLLDDRVMTATMIARVHAGLSLGKTRFVFTAALSRQDVDDVFNIAIERGITRDAAAEKIAHGIGRLAAELIETFRPTGVLLTGGDTAIRTVQALQATGISIEGEVLPGIQYGRLTGCALPSLIATKSGGFGAPDAISKTFEFFKV